MKTANKIGLWLIDFDLEKNYGIIRCTHQTKEVMISALSLIRSIDECRIIFSPIKTSGTIKKLKEWIIEKKIYR
ncbi:MAG: Ribonuclease P protein component 2 [Promethearchaeota archaeon]|nr:MAG: Ribonuclease P protein component 2 [Candidatus Lokiarchaeota archaeon]